MLIESPGVSSSNFLFPGDPNYQIGDEDLFPAHCSRIPISM